MASEPLLSRVREIAEAQSGLSFVVVFGSRARGDAHPRSDWDFGYIGDSGFDPDALRVELVRALETDSVDLVDLTRATGLLRYQAARDGLLLFERAPAAFERFQEHATRFWLDVQPIVEAAHRAILAKVGT